MRALEQIQSLGGEISREEWEPLLNNLGHLHRQLNEFEEAISFHQRALALAPHNADTYACIGFSLCHMKKYGEALDYLHRSLSLRHDDVFVVSLLEYVLEEFIECDNGNYIDKSEELDDSGPPPTLSFPAIPNNKLEDQTEPNNTTCDESHLSIQEVESSTLEKNNQERIDKGAVMNKAIENWTPVGGTTEAFCTPDDAQPIPVGLINVGRKTKMTRMFSTNIESAEDQVGTSSNNKSSCTIPGTIDFTKTPDITTLPINHENPNNLVQPKSPEPSTHDDNVTANNSDMDIDDTL